MLALAAHIPPVPCKTSSIFGPFFLGLLLLACDLALLHRAYLSFNMGRAPREILDKDMRCRAFIRAGWKHERFAQDGTAADPEPIERSAREQYGAVSSLNLRCRFSAGGKDGVGDAATKRSFTVSRATNVGGREIANQLSHLVRQSADDDSKMALPVCVTTFPPYIPYFIPHRSSRNPHSLISIERKSSVGYGFIRYVDVAHQEAAAGGLTLLVQIPPAPVFLFLAYAANMGIYS
ncbi:hypothetical protein B0H13DRAFT_2285023 [Mycena leptocephala]|nr:hypothetical protein B0H13DRAFT_2285023 [Mycena leptocephala]